MRSQDTLRKGGNVELSVPGRRSTTDDLKDVRAGGISELQSGL